MRKILFGVSKGGSGKTSSAICTAYILNRLGHKTLYIDGDPQCTGAYFFNAKPSGDNVFSIVDIAYEQARGKKFDVRNAIQHCDNGDIIVNSGSGKSTTDFASMSISMNESLAYHYFDGFNGLTEYEYIIIDTGPEKSLLLRELIAVSDTIIFPVCASSSVEGAYLELPLINSVRTSTNRIIQIGGFLMTSVFPREKSYKAFRKDVEDSAAELHTKVFNTEIRRTAAFSRSFENRMIPIARYPSDDASKDYVSFVRELLHEGE